HVAPSPWLTVTARTGAVVAAACRGRVAMALACTLPLHLPAHRVHALSPLAAAAAPSVAAAAAAACAGAAPARPLGTNERSGWQPLRESGCQMPRPLSALVPPLGRPNRTAVCDVARLGG